MSVYQFVFCMYVQESPCSFLCLALLLSRTNSCLFSFWAILVYFKVHFSSSSSGATCCTLRGWQMSLKIQLTQILSRHLSFFWNLRFKVDCFKGWRSKISQKNKKTKQTQKNQPYFHLLLVEFCFASKKEKEKQQLRNQ